jgi:hypothetical protein
MKWCNCMHCLRNQRFQQGTISGEKSSRTAMKFVFRRTIAYQHGISTTEYVPEKVQSCTAMYYHVLPCTAMYCQSTNSYVFVRSFGHLSAQVLYVPVCTAMRKFTKSTYLYIHHKSTRRYILVHIGTYLYVQPYTRCTGFQMLFPSD